MFFFLRLAQIIDFIKNNELVGKICCINCTQQDDYFEKLSSEYCAIITQMTRFA